MMPDKMDCSILASTRWCDLDPGHSLLDELARSNGVRERVINIDSVVADCRMKVAELKYKLSLPHGVTEDGLGALVAYTHDNQTGKRAGNLYFELNVNLRARGIEQRAVMMKVWGGYMFYAMAALAALPAHKGIVYRGYPDKREVLEEYKLGRPIQWGAFASTTTDLQASRGFTDKTDGVIFKLTVLSGRSINDFSFFPTEGEILLTPSHRFTVSSEPYEIDGYTMLDMLEQKGEAFIS